MKTVAFATDHAHPSLEPDDLLVVPELEKRGVRVVPVIWDSLNVDWTQYAAVVVRSTWDYTLCLPEYRAWIDRLRAAGVLVLNPPSVLLWNTDKVYLRELEAAGVAVVPTEWIERYEEPVADAVPLSESVLLSRLRDAVDRRGWSRFVLKSSVSASGAKTYCLDRAALERGLPELPEAGTLMVQEFMGEVQTEGECSYLFYGGRLSHAILKRPQSGNFLSQHFHGGSIARIDVSGASEAGGGVRVDASGGLPSAHALLGMQFAQLALDAGERICGARTLYARVDMIRRGSVFYLGELEMVEPCLFFGQDAHAAPERFAEALVQRLGV